MRGARRVGNVNDALDERAQSEARRIADKDRQARRMGVALWARIARLYTRNNRLGAALLRTHDLSVAQFDVLAQIGAHESYERLTQQELAQRLLVTEGNITQLLDKLEERGLISRCREGRIKRLVLTDEGRRLRDAAVPAQERFQAEQFAALSIDEQRTLLRLLGKLQRAGRTA
jgi:DNA-binding MarR family transcriptional regulator